jgi:5-formyltetrahydrofolate cyclo-ligase
MTILRFFVSALCVSRNKNAMTKKELRVKYKQLRSALSETEIEELSLAIANQLLSLDLWDNNYFHVFLPIDGKTK